MTNLQAARIYSLIIALSILTFTLNTAPAGARMQSSQSAPVFQDLRVGSKTFEVGRIEINASAKDVWNVITDYANTPNIFPYVNKCRVLSETGSTKVLYQSLRISGCINDITEFLELTETPTSLVQWHSLSGSSHETEGYWKLDASGDGQTIVTFAKYVNAGPFVPQPFIRHILQTDMTPVLVALKTHVEKANPAF